MREKHDYTWYDIKVLDDKGAVMFRTGAGRDGTGRGLNAADIVDMLNTDYAGVPYRLFLGNWEIAHISVDDIQKHDARAIRAAMNVAEHFDDFMYALNGGYEILVGSYREAAEWWLNRHRNNFFVENFREAIDAPKLGALLVEKGYLVYGREMSKYGENVYVDFFV